MSKFAGTFDNLKTLLQQKNVTGVWGKGNGCFCFKTNHNEANVGILNFWEKKGSYNIQGKGAGKTQLEEVMNSSASAGSCSSEDKPADAAADEPFNKVFVVYGHNTAARTQLENLLRKWHLEPVILDNLPSSGQTIIEKLEKYTSEIGYGIVLATADDEGFKRGKEDEKAFRARQNVVLELGMLLVKLGRSRVAILLETTDKLEKPSDISGLVYIPFIDDVAKDAGLLLAKEMSANGYNIDVKTL